MKINEHLDLVWRPEFDIVDELLVAGHPRHRLLLLFRLPHEHREVVAPRNC